MALIFDWCVNAMVWLAPHLSLTYEELNVWLFVVLHPLITLTLLARLWWTRRHSPGACKCPRT